MAMSVEDRVRKASRAHSRNAQTRRFQRYVAEMRDAGLAVTVRDEGPDGAFFDVPAYTVTETNRIAYGTPR
jgi:hypothetical protein